MSPILIFLVKELRDAQRNKYLMPIYLVLPPIAIGLCLTLIHLISIPVTNTSVNPARSTGVAVFVGGWAIQPLWLFWVAPIASEPSR